MECVWLRRCPFGVLVSDNARLLQNCATLVGYEVCSAHLRSVQGDYEFHNTYATYCATPKPLLCFWTVFS
jgi:hypothetical protein